MPSGHSGFLGLLYDWQSLLAGILAFVAGILAYVAGNKQENLIWTHNQHLIHQEKRDIARRVHTASVMLLGALAFIDDRIRDARKIATAPGFQITRMVPADSRIKIKKPPIEVVWTELGFMGGEVAPHYIMLDTAIEEFVESHDFNLHTFENELQNLSILVEHLSQEIAKGREEANKLLLKTQKR